MGILDGVIVAAISGTIAGLITWGGLRKDVARLVKDVEKLWEHMVPRTECTIRHENLKR